MKYKAAILGYYGFGNLGDELLLTACLEMFGRCGVGREGVIVLSNAPDETSRVFGVASVNRWRLREVVRALRESESLVLGGGGIFQDSTSVKSCVWYWGVVRLARLFGCRVWALGQSVGPLRCGVSRVVAGNALRGCRVLHVRGESSREVAESLGCKNVITGSDLVMTLREDSLSPAHTHIREDARDADGCSNPVTASDLVMPLCGKSSECSSPAHTHIRGEDSRDAVGCSNPVTSSDAMPPKPQAQHSEGKYTLLNLRPCENLPGYVRILTPHLQGKNVIGAALSDEDTDALTPLNLPEIVRVKTFRDARNLWAGASEAVGMRLHFGVLSRIFSTPLALMPYDVKVREFAAQSGVPCIVDEWAEPVAPLAVPECSSEIDGICREILAL